MEYFSFIEPFSDEQLEQNVLNAYKVSANFTDKLVEVFRSPEYFRADEFYPFELKEIHQYLVLGHQHFLNHWIPKIQASVDQLIIKFGADYPSVKLLKLFLMKYKIELENHILFEEQVLFRFVENLLKGTYNEQQRAFVFNHFLSTHNDHVVIQIEKLRRELLQHDPELKQNLLFRIVFNQLELFQMELYIHGMIEDEVLVPKTLTYIKEKFES